MSKKPKKNNLAALTEPAPGTVANASVPSAFQARANVATPKNVIVKSMSPLLRPALWPKIDGANAVLIGRFTKIFQTSPSKNKVGEGVEIVPDGAPVGVALPVTTTLKTGLEITGEGAKATSPFLGRTVEIELMPERIKSKKGQDAWHFVVAIYPEDKKA